MKLQVLQEELTKALSTSIHFVNVRSTLPVLANFMLVAEKTKLKIMATNLEMSIATNIGAKIEKEGRITIPAKAFTEIISNLNQGQLDLEVDKEKLNILSQGFSGTLLTTPSNDFPNIPDTLSTENSFNLIPNDLQKAISKVLFSASIDEGRPILTGVLFVFEKETIDLVASDGFRLSQKRITLPKKIVEEKTQMVIPKSFLLELSKMAKGESSLLFELKQNENQAILKVGETILATRLIDGSFPDFEKIIPKNPTTKVSIDKNDLGKAVRLAGIFAREENGIVKFTINEDSIEISSEGGKTGKEKSKIEAKVEGGILEILFNYKFVEEFLSVVEGEDVQLELIDGDSPAIFKDPKDPTFLHLIMPVKIQS